MNKILESNLDIVDYFYENRSKYLFNDWAKDQITSYLLIYFQFNQVRCLVKDNLIIGVIVFEEMSGDTLHIIHFLTDKRKETLILFLGLLDFEYPYVKYLSTKRKSTRTFVFPVEKLNNILTYNKYPLVDKIFNN